MANCMHDAVDNETIENDNDYDGNDRKYDDDRK